MTGFLSNRVLLFLVRCVLGLVFVFASIEKITVPEAFAISVEAFRLLPFSLVNLFALLVPWMELLCGIFLLAGYNLRGTSLVTGLLLAGFTAAILSAMARGLKIDCGCFGAAYQAPVGWPRVLEDLGMLAAALYLYLFSGRQAESGEPAAGSR